MHTISTSTLQAFLDERLGPDRRSKASTYADAVSMLRALGFTTIEQLNSLLVGANDLDISRVATGGRMGQIHRLELMLLARMGTDYIHRHPWGYLPLWRKRQRKTLRALKKAGHSS
jgi:hypothetical protein